MIDRTKISELKDWLARQALMGAPPSTLTAHTAETLASCGLPLLRVYVGMSAVHPQVESIGAAWRRAGVEEEVYAHGALAAAEATSPIFQAVMGARGGRAGRGGIPMTRYRIERGEGLEFALLAQFRAEGATDYLCFVMVFGEDGRIAPNSAGAAVSFCADRAGGFDETEIEAIRDVLPAFGAALRAAAQTATMRSILDTYLGRDIGRRVLKGEIRRGAVEAIEAAILIADLRGFTTLSDETRGDALTAMLDAYLDCAVGAVEAAGGTVLKFLGDGLIATFAFAPDAAANACARALEAAQAIDAGMAEINAARLSAGAPVSTFDLALHAGEVMFGNVGAARRLDFTIVGPAVNEAARLEMLCAPLGAAVLASRAFVTALAAPERFVSLGLHGLKGVRAPVEVFALA